MNRLLCSLGVVLTALAASAADGQDPFGDIRDLKLAKPEDKVDVPTTPAPKGAVLLFDSKSLDNWLNRNGKDPAAWKVLDGGILEVKSPTSDIITKEKFTGRFKLHVEFRVGYQPNAKGQRRGNSGVYLQGAEVVLDSYGAKGGLKDDCAPLQHRRPAATPASAPILAGYDINSPREMHGRQKTDPAVATVYTTASDSRHVKLTTDNTLRGLGGNPYARPDSPQENGCPVRYRSLVLPWTPHRCVAMFAELQRQPRSTPWAQYAVWLKEPNRAWRDRRPIKEQNGGT